MENNKIILSILICTVEGREQKLSELMSCLAQQIRKHNLDDVVEILTSKDKKGENTIGYKRNLLLKNCVGEWAAFIDDDDMVSFEYVPSIIKLLKQTNPDVVGIEGIITINGHTPKKFIHSINYTRWYEQGGIYFRPPNHLNPIRTSISKQFSFPEINNGEDMEWSLAICKKMVLQNEAYLEKPCYFYNYVDVNK